MQRGAATQESVEVPNRETVCLGVQHATEWDSTERLEHKRSEEMITELAVGCPGPLLAENVNGRDIDNDRSDTAEEHVKRGRVFENEPLLKT